MNLQEKINASISYTEYRQLIDQLLEKGLSTELDAVPESYAEYSALNVTRMNRLDKKTELTPAVLSAIGQVKEQYTWLTLTEGWCGDAAQNLPIFEKVAQASQHIELRLVLRHEHPELMDAYLTNGGKSIPKIIVIRKRDGEVVTTWGPRPAPVQEMMMEYKHDTSPDKPPYSELTKQVQLWYARDKTKTTQSELVGVLNAMS